MKFAVIGLGGTGGYLGGLLVRAGEQVCFITRGRALNSISKDGLEVRSELNGDFSVRPAYATDDTQKAAEGFGIPAFLFHLCKGLIPRWAIASAKPLMPWNHRDPAAERRRPWTADL